LREDDEIRLRFVDDYEVKDVALALRRMEWSDKARILVKGLAGAPNRTLSRLEMARTIGSDSVNSTNSALGHFAKKLALAIDSDLEKVWKPEGKTGGDWVMFACVGGNRTSPPPPGDTDPWAFVMREVLAQALAQAGIAPYVEISEDAATALWGEPDDTGEDDADDEDVSEDDDEPVGRSDNPMEDLDFVQSLGELDDLSETEREAVISARVGQGRFRDALLERWDGRCAVTGLAIPEVLIASHIKPWFLATNVERLDPANGLLLVATLDRLFDYGLISFDQSGTIMLSPRLSAESCALLHLTPRLRLREVPADTAEYLRYHRAECYWESEEDSDDADDE